MRSDSRLINGQSAGIFAHTSAGPQTMCRPKNSGGVALRIVYTYADGMEIVLRNFGGAIKLIVELELPASESPDIPEVHFGFMLTAHHAIKYGHDD